ncbi:hypothetical protein [Breoghania sp.]|uniref:hypothetical protein n=1 Tax=Breoghania sp. TaxID=2065378 RepID=UPI002AAB1A8E|nr:hypothetical protein [Breoghania sp.]
MIVVKQLEWTTTPPPDRECVPGMLYAEGIGGTYEVTDYGVLWWAHDPFSWTQLADQAAAMAAAQADHETRLKAMVCEVVA